MEKLAMERSHMYTEEKIPCQNPCFLGLYCTLMIGGGGVRDVPNDEIFIFFLYILSFALYRGPPAAKAGVFLLLA
jgi:hypothetical protein